MITSKLTPDAQTTLPEAVRAALRLQTGDDIAYLIEGDRVTLMRSGARAVEDPFAIFEEWRGDADTKAYGNL